jgi:elongation factor P
MIANELRTKNVIKINNKLFKVITIDHTKPGKGHAYIVLALKNLHNGNKQKIRFRVNDKVENIMVREEIVTYTYSSNDIFFFLNEEGDEIAVSGDQVPYKKLIVSGMKYKILYADDDIVSVSLPDDLKVEVAFSPPFITGQSAASQLKTIRTTSNIEIDVPQYIKKGDILKINSDLEFLSRD